MLASPGGLFTAFRERIEIDGFLVKESLRERGYFAQKLSFNRVLQMVA
jgi:hypothetical protein